MKHLPLLIASLLVSACGGSGDDPLGSSSGIRFNGNQQAASINAQNAALIGTAAGESVQRAAFTGSLPAPINAVSSATLLMNASADDDTLIPEDAAEYSASAVFDSCSSGSASVIQTTLNSGAISQTFTYRQCKLTGLSSTADGKLQIVYNNINNLSLGFELIYTNFVISNSVVTSMPLNVRVTCANTSTCTYHSDFIGDDGITHRVTSFNLTGNASTGFNGSAVFFHGIHGRVSIASSGLTYGNCSNRPNGGIIAFSSTNGSSGTIDFDPDCSVSGTWTNNTGSAAF